MKILFCHFGVYKKDGWGRTFSLAKGLAKQGDKVVLLTTNGNFSLITQSIIIDKVKIIIFPEIVPKKFSSKGFGILSLVLKLGYAFFTKFDIVHSDSGHRPASGWPCIINKFVYKSKYFAEWWDFFGKGGQLDNKPKYFRMLLGKFESWSEINDKKKADGIIILSDYMKKRAIKLGFAEDKLKVIRGGADIENIPQLTYLSTKEILRVDTKKLVFGYIGMSNNEVTDLSPFLKAITKFKDRILFVTFGKEIDKKIITKYHLENVLKEMGWIDFSKDAQKLGVVDIFILIKSDNVINNAGWPNKLGDYLACGKPILVTLYKSIEQFVKKYSDCFITCSWEIGDIEKKILKILNNEYDLVKMGLISRKIAEENSWDEKSKELRRFYIK